MRAGWSLTVAGCAAGLVVLAAAGCYEGYVDTREDTSTTDVAQTDVAPTDVAQTRFASTRVTPTEPALATFAMG